MELENLNHDYPSVIFYLVEIWSKFASFDLSKNNLTIQYGLV